MRNTMTLWWLDLLVLKLIGEGKPQQRELLDLKTRIEGYPNVKGGLINQFIIDNQVDPIFSPTVSSMSVVVLAVERLRNAGFMQPSGDYEVTDEGARYIQSALCIHYTKWPITIEFRDGKYLFDQPNYILE